MAETLASLILSALPVVQRFCCLITSEAEFLSRVSSDVDWLREELANMRSFLQQSTAEAVGIDRLRDAIYEAEDIVEIFDLQRSRSVYANPRLFSYLKSTHELGSRVVEIKSTLAEISRRRSLYKIKHDNGAGLSFHHRLHNLLASSPLVLDGDLVGFDEDLKILLGWVMDEDPQLCILSLVGMGGIGKTTLIKRLYNHEDVKRRFDRSAWIYVSQSNRLREVFSEMAKRLMGVPSAEVDALNERELQEGLLSCLEQRRFLIVFDDVWDKRMWDFIKLVLPTNNVAGSRVIITTRNAGVASTVVDVKNHVHKLSPLAMEESWALFLKKALAAGDVAGGCPEELKEMAEGIVRKCGGVPLAVVTVGHMMSRKERSLVEWRRVLDSMSRDFWNGDHDDGVRRALLFSYKDLPYPLGQCFLLCSMFPDDYEISRKRLVRLWLAEGFIQDERGEVVEDVAEKYLMELINRNMIQVSMLGSSGKVKACRIHDLLHQLSISISHEESFSTKCDDQRTVIPKMARRISMHSNYSNSECKKSKWQIRSLLMFGTKQPLHSLNNFMRGGIWLLRVLDLEDACLTKLPSEVGDLMHLRYLSLKGTEIMKLPHSLKNLLNLQTLDIRKTNIRKLPFSLQNVKQLRHLEMKQVEKSITAPKGISFLEKLQVVTGLQASGTIAHEIRMLTQLRKLSIEQLKAGDSIPLCSSINNMASLSSLSMFSIDEPKMLDLSSLVPSPSLHKLHIAGYLGRLPNWFCTMKSLTKLRLGLSRLSEDPFPVLKDLPSLVFLQLYEAFGGQVMRCSSPGFKKLKILILTGLDSLEEWEVEEGAMPCIQELWIMSCSELKAIPLGFEFLTTLQKLRLVDMPENFVKRISSEPAGEDFGRVQHIPSIQVPNAWN